MNTLNLGDQVIIRHLSDSEIDAFDNNIGFVSDMRKCFGRIGKIIHVRGSYYVVAMLVNGEVDALSWNWPASALTLVSNNTVTHDKPAMSYDPERTRERMDLEQQGKRNEEAKMEYLRSFVKAAEAREPERASDQNVKEGVMKIADDMRKDFEKAERDYDRDDKKPDYEAEGMVPSKSGGYDQVLYGRCESFARMNGVATGIFFVFFKAERVSFKLSDPDLYGDANRLIRTMLSPNAPLTDALGGVIMVLDKDGYVQLTRSEL